MLRIPRTRLKTYSDKAFEKAGSELWNELAELVQMYYGTMTLVDIDF